MLCPIFSKSSSKIDVLSIKLTGGNSGEAVLQPVLRRRNRVLEFSGVTSAFGGGVDTFSETITFLKPHNLVSGQVLVYDKNKNTQLGIGTFKGSNLANFESLIDVFVSEGSISE